MTDDRVETHVAIADPDAPSGRRVVHFQEYWVRLRAEVPAEAVVVGRARRRPRPAPGVIDAITDADLVVVPPSQPGRLASARSSACPGSARRCAPPRAPVVGLSPIIGGTHVRGMADQLLTAIGVEVSAAGVGLHYGARSADGGVLDGWLVDERRRRRGRPGRRRPGSRAAAVPLLMTDHDATAAMAARRGRRWSA